MKIEYNKNYFLHLFVQGLAATVIVFIVLFFLDYIRAGHLIWAAGASTLASTAFIVFATPTNKSAQPHRIIIGYAIAILCGHFVRMLADYFCQGVGICQDPEYLVHVHEVAAVIGLVLAFLFMLLFRSAHPPAAGLAIVMVIDISNIDAMIVIGASALCLALIKFFFKNKLKCLV